MIINFRKTDARAVTPTKAHESDAGFDLTAISMEFSSLYNSYDTGLAVEIPEGYVGLVFPRSSVSNTGMVLANAVGVIDSSYRGTIQLRFRRLEGREYAVGERVGQLVILELPQIDFKEVHEFEEETDRGTGGWGSSGR